MSSYFTLRSVRRKNLSSILVKQILFQYDYKCAVCGSTLTPTHELDHKKSLTHPHWLSMPDDEAELLANRPNNIQPLCRECHAVKTQRETLRDITVRQSVARSIQGLSCPVCLKMHSPYFYPKCLLPQHTMKKK